MKTEAGFVKLENKNSERFKYFKEIFIDKLTSNNLLFFKRKVNSWVQGTKLLLNKLDWKCMGKEFSLWTIEAAVEGVAWNFALATLFGFQFTAMTALAYGVLSKQALSLYWRLKKDGTTATIHTTA